MGVPSGSVKEKLKLWWNMGTSEPMCQEPGAQILAFTI